MTITCTFEEDNCGLTSDIDKQHKDKFSVVVAGKDDMYDHTLNSGTTYFLFLIELSFCGVWTSLLTIRLPIIPTSDYLLSPQQKHCLILAT